MPDLLDDLDQYATALENSLPETDDLPVDLDVIGGSPGDSPTRSRVIWIAAAAALVAVALVGVGVATSSTSGQTVAADDPQSTSVDPPATETEPTYEDIHDYVAEVEATDRVDIFDPFAEPDAGPRGYASWELSTQRDPETGLPVHPVVPVYSFEDDSEIGYFYVGFGFVDPAIADAPGFDINEYIGHDINEPFRRQHEANSAD